MATEQTKLIDKIEREHIAKPDQPVTNFMAAMERIKEKDWEWEVKQVCWRYMHALMPLPAEDHKLTVDKLKHLRDWWIKALRALSIGADLELAYLNTLDADGFAEYQQRLKDMEEANKPTPDEDEDDENIDDAIPDTPDFDDYDNQEDD